MLQNVTRMGGVDKCVKNTETIVTKNRRLDNRINKQKPELQPQKDGGLRSTKLCTLVTQIDDFIRNQIKSLFVNIQTILGIMEYFIAIFLSIEHNF